MRYNPQLLARERSRGKARIASLPAPVGGWNTEDSLAAMAPEFATRLDNWFPQQGLVTVRPGYTEWATGVGAGAVNSIVPYDYAGTRKLLAASATNIYDISSTGAGSSLGGGFSNGKWQHLQFHSNALLMNGADTPQVYNGSTIANWTATGPTIANVIGGHVHGHRIYVWEDNKLSFWYGGVDTLAGAYTEFPLGYIQALGGKLVAMGTWSHDAGDGQNDYAVFVLSSGQAVVYQGTNPGDATAWALVGVYYIGAPLGVRALVKIGADLRITTVDDYISLATLQRYERGQNRTKIRSAVVAAAQSASGVYGWQSIVYPRGGMVIHNVPTNTGVFQQHVQSILTGAWCRFVDIPAVSWGLHQDRLYFGHLSNGKVYKFDDGNDDDSVAIAADGRQAWSALGYNGRKRVPALRIIAAVEGAGTYEYGLGFDFTDATATTPTTITGDNSPWDTSTWDISMWSSEFTIDETWRAAAGTGQHVSLRMRVNSVQPVTWIRVDYRYEAGVNL